MTFQVARETIEEQDSVRMIPLIQGTEDTHEMAAGSPVAAAIRVRPRTTVHKVKSDKQGSITDRPISTAKDEESFACYTRTRPSGEGARFKR